MGTGEHIGIVSPHQGGAWNKGHPHSTLCSTCCRVSCCFHVVQACWVELAQSPSSSTFPSLADPVEAQASMSALSVRINSARGAKGIFFRLCVQRFGVSLALLTWCNMVELNYCGSLSCSTFPVLWNLLRTGEHVGIFSSHQFGPRGKGHPHSAPCSTCW